MDKQIQNQFSIGITYNYWKIFGWVSPFGTRRKNVFCSGDDTLHFDLDRQELRESGNNQESILATLNLRRARPLANHHYGWIGTVSVTGGTAITMALDELDGTLFTVTDTDSRSWRFRIDGTENVSVQISGIQISANIGSYGWNPEKNCRVHLHCGDEKLRIAKVLGVLVCSLLFDCLLDPGGHT